MQLVCMHYHTHWCNGEACNIFSFTKNKTNHALFFINLTAMLHVYSHKYLFLPATLSAKFTTRPGLGFSFEAAT